MNINRYVKWWLKPPVFLLCLGPLASLCWKIYDVQVRGGNSLGGDPQAFIRSALGTWTLVFLCITLGISPARKLTRQFWLIRFRRMVGLFAFFYGSLHLITYVWFDTGWDWAAIVHDVSMRPFITMGFTAWVLMVPLAITSTSGWVRRLGGKRWQLLHRVVYFSAIAGVIHYYWLVKSDVTIPLRFAYVIGALLLYRIVVYAVEKLRGAPKREAKQPMPTTSEFPSAPISEQQK